MRQVLLAAVATLSVVLVAGCGDATPTGPPELRLGVDVCDRCAMAIAEPRYAAAALVDDDGGQRTLKFDDIGCLAIWEAGASGAKIRARWVHDRSTEAWTDASTAAFSQTRELTTPMGSGLAAFRSASEADALVADRGGERLSWDALLARARTGALQANPFPRQEAAR
jgi:copper chaperone NosL